MPYINHRYAKGLPRFLFSSRGSVHHRFTRPKENAAERDHACIARSGLCPLRGGPTRGTAFLNPKPPGMLGVHQG